jgi:hypothetical protein
MYTCTAYSHECSSYCHIYDLLIPSAGEVLPAEMCFMAATDYTTRNLLLI